MRRSTGIAVDSRSKGFLSFLNVHLRIISNAALWCNIEEKHNNTTFYTLLRAKNSTSDTVGRCPDHVWMDWPSLSRTARTAGYCIIPYAWTFAAPVRLSTSISSGLIRRLSSRSFSSATLRSCSELGRCRIYIIPTSILYLVFSIQYWIWEMG